MQEVIKERVQFTMPELKVVIRKLDAVSRRWNGSHPDELALAVAKLKLLKAYSRAASRSN